MKFKNKLATITSIIIIVSTLTACQNTNSNTNIPQIGYEISSTKNTTNDVETTKFNLGESIIKEATGKNIPFQIEGIISIPKNLKEKTPVVLIFHGQHSDKSNTDFEDGFKYLTEDLAKNGIIGISIDTSVNYSFENGEPSENERIISLAQTHLDALKEANEGKNQNYKIDLKDKVDLSKVGLIGHSVGGSGVLRVASDQINKGNNNIKGIISLVPAYNAVIEEFPDVKTSIIVSEYDGDVIHSGTNLYRTMTSDKNRKNPIGMTYLVGGNHNSFNTVLGEKEFSDPQDTNGTYPEKLNKENSRDFFSNFAVDYMKSIFEFENSQSPIFNKEEALPSKMYGYQTLNKTYYSDSKILYDKNSYKDAISKNTDIKVVVEADSPDIDTAGLFKEIGYVKELELLNIDWKSKDASVEIPLKEKNLNEYSSIVFNWALNSPSKLNSEDNPIDFNLTLIDNKGKESSVNIRGDKVSSMKYFNGVPIKDEYLEGKYLHYWSRYTPISETSIPLDNFIGIDMSNIKSVRLDFNKSETGSIYINKVYGQK